MKEVHPLTAYIPETADQSALSMDIAQSGPREPVILYEGKVIEGRVRYRSCLEIGVQPQFKDWVLIADGDPLDWMVRTHIAQHSPVEFDRIRLVAAVLPYYQQMKGNTEIQLWSATEVSRRKIRAISWLHEAEKLDRVLSGEIDVIDAGRSAGFVAEKKSLALGKSYGSGDKFDDSTQPLIRYLASWGKKNYEFRHINPREASRRLQIVDRLVEGLTAARVDLEKRSHVATLSAPPERKERR